MTVKDTYFIKVTDSDRGISGVGECAIFRGLSKEDTPLYEDILARTCRDIEKNDISNIKESSIKMGFETALNDLKNGGKFRIFDSPWQDGKMFLPINGLIWMGDFDIMMERINEKIKNGFRCIKIKIGGIDFNKETELIKYIRHNFNAHELQLRLDANGSMSPTDALHKLDILSRYDIHSLEQPIMAGQWKAMKYITRHSPIDIALDEELIGNMGYDERCYLLDATMPRYIILKPSLHGGFSTCDGWIKDAAEREIAWWATSALESNIGLNAIAQWTASKKLEIPQGLGTGALYSNNIVSPLEVTDASLRYNTSKSWEFNVL